MKKILSLVLVGVMGLWLVSCNEKGGNGANSPLVDSLSLNLGELMGSNIKEQIKVDSTLDMKEVIKGIEASIKVDTTNHGYMAGLYFGNQILSMIQGMQQRDGISINERKFMESLKKALLSDSVMSQEVMTQKGTALEGLVKRAKAEAKKNDPVAMKNKKDGEEFLKKKAAQAGYQKTPSGIVYKVIKEGEGANFTDQDVVMVKYRGTHIDGKEFDASKDEAVPFRLNGVVPGFAEILKLMKPGQKVEVVIPSDLAYGDDGNPPVIGPFETLVFEIETVGKKDPKAAPLPGNPARK